MSASPTSSTARRALPNSLTSPSNSSTTTVLAFVSAPVWSSTGGASRRTAKIPLYLGWL
jgi:hypothetical protein